MGWATLTNALQIAARIGAYLIVLLLAVLWAACALDSLGRPLFDIGRPAVGDVIISIGSLDKQNAQRRRQGVIDELLDRSFEPTRPADAGLRHSNDAKPGISRKMGKLGFEYRDPRGRRVHRRSGRSCLARSAAQSRLRRSPRASDRSRRARQAGADHAAWKSSWIASCVFTLRRR